MPTKTYNDIVRELKGGTIAPLYFFYGSEQYFVNSLVDLAEKEVLNPGEEAFNKTVFYGKDSDAGMVADQVRRFPMMAERQLVILKEAQALKGFDDLKPIFDKPVPTTVFVVAYHREKMDKRFAVFKSIAANAVVLEAKKLYENQIPTWFNGLMKEQKIKLSPRAITLLIEYLGADLEKLANAIQKLTIIGSKGDISDKMVEETIGISRVYNVYELQEAMGTRNEGQILKIGSVMEKDLKNNPLPMVIPSLFTYISKLYMIQPLGANLADVKKVLRIRSDFIVKKYMTAAKMYSAAEFEKMIHILREYDLKSKGVEIRDVSSEELFRELILRLVHIA